MAGRLPLLLFFLAVLLSSSVMSQDGFETSESGLKYKFHATNPEARKPLVGDMMKLNIIYNINGDTVFYDSRVNPEPMLMELKESSYPGDINEGLSMMHLGDSATFLINASDFFMQTVKVPEIPEPFKAEDIIHFEIVLTGIMSQEDYIKEQQQAYMQKEQEKVAAREKEVQQIADYISQSEYEFQDLGEGLRIAHIQEGTGPAAAPGKTVKVHYRGTLLNGEEFDSSYKRGQPIQVRLGANQVIRGWEKGIPYIKKGGKAILIIPFDLGYGERPAGSIPSFSTLVFEVELVEVSE